MACSKGTLENSAKKTIISPGEVFTSLEGRSHRMSQSLSSQAEAMDLHTHATCELSLPEWCKTIPELFEAQVEQTPNHIAVIYQNESLTYQTLNEKANQFAHYLRREYQIKPDDLIALCLKRSEWLLIAILGILKAGAAYVPLDPDYPVGRMQHILKDIHAKAIFTESSSVLSLEKIVLDSSLNAEVRAIDSNPFQHVLEMQSKENLTLAAQANNLAYVIYTSGTTGVPKGVLQTHENIHHLFVVTADSYGFNQDDVWVLFHAYVFDFSVWEMWGALFFGGKLIVAPIEATKDVCLFYSLCQQHKVSVLNITPAVFYPFMAHALTQRPEDQLNALRYVIFGGDLLNLLKLEPWYRIYPKTKLVNMYGITETTVHVTYYLIDSHHLSAASVIGAALPAKRTYILDEYLNPVPMGETGELYVGGDGLARGYLNLPELTAARFIKNPYQSQAEKQRNKNSRLYRTGDLARQLSDGRLVYVGRNDSQVKIRGFRIELGEIENTLLNYPGVQQAIVLVKSRDDHKLLVGYFVGDGIDENSLKQYLMSILPDYMVPTQLLKLAAMPLTINGKINHQLLPEPDLSVREHYVAPTMPIEKAICSLYADILGIDEQYIGIDDDFFQLGGDSLTSVQLAHRLRCDLSLNIGVKDIFIHRTIRQLYQYVISDNASMMPLTIKDDHKWTISDWQGILARKDYRLSDFKAYESYTIMSRHKGTQVRRLFMLPPGDGGYESYINTLVPCLEDIELAMFNNFYLFVKNKIPIMTKTLTIERLASLYIADIKTVQPCGPYYFFGWSYGGVLALEIARQLKLMGDTVDSIIMVDSIFAMDDYCKLTGDVCYDSNKLFYDYKPNFHNVSFKDTKLILIKSKHAPLDYSHQNYKLFKYMVEHALYNHLDKLIDKRYIDIISMNGDHLNWVNDKNSIDIAVEIINKTINA